MRSTHVTPSRDHGVRWAWRALGMAASLAACSASALAQPYAIPQAVFPGGGGTSTGGPFVVTGTIAQGVAGEASSGGAYTVTGGFTARRHGHPEPRVADPDHHRADHDGDVHRDDGAPAARWHRQ